MEDEKEKKGKEEAIPQEAESVEPTIQLSREEKQKKENIRFLIGLGIIFAIFIGIALYLYSTNSAPIY